MPYSKHRNLDTINALVPHLDIAGFWSYIGECEILLANGAHCHQPAAGYFTANGDLRKVEMCQFHICMTMIKLWERLEKKGADSRKLLEQAGEQGFLKILLEELGDDAAPILGSLD